MRNPMLAQLRTTPKISPDIVNQARQIMNMPEKMNAVMQFVGGRSVEPLVRQMAAQKGIDLNDLFDAMK